MPHPIRLAVAATLAALPVAALALYLAAPASAQGAPPSFEDVAAIFTEHCTVCHSGPAAPVGLALDGFAGVMAGSARTPVVVPGDPEASELVKRIRGTSLPRMPLTGPPYLDDRQIDTIVAWIAAGAPAPAAADPSDGRPAPPPASVGAEAASGTFEHVHGILLRRCASCHAPNGRMGPPPEGFVVATYDAILAGGERVAVVPGVPLASELLRRIEGRSLPRMPFDGPPYLSDEEIASIRTWIERGAPGPDGSPAAVPVGAEVRLGGVLTGRWELDGLPVEVSSQTRFDDAPDVGSRVEVRGVVLPGGGVRATRIRVR